ncbi:hypothetical protein Scep_030398 [Stephania cephalantha]|uniref:Uncharacterized protein n=1 Tax=Stephania cephalantha TaxID=152367 RepID=A0AAP0E401_9MAGN
MGAYTASDPPSLSSSSLRLHFVVVVLTLLLPLLRRPLRSIVVLFPGRHPRASSPVVPHLADPSPTLTLTPLPQASVASSLGRSSRAMPHPVASRSLHLLAPLLPGSASSSVVLSPTPHPHASAPGRLAP